MNNKNDYDKIEEAFDKLYDKYQQILLKASNTKKGEDLYGYQTRFFQAMEEGANGFKIAAKNIVDKYINGTDESVSMALKSFGAKYGGNAIKLTTYVRMADVLTQSVNKYRNDIQAKILEREKQGKVTTVGDLQGIIQEDLTNGEGTSVKYANGAKMPVGKYAAMLARTTRAETDNLAMIQQALKEGIDLLKCGTVSPTCDICSVYQGRVYSISGKDSRYPALYQTAFKSGYSIIHPNCRHSWTPYHIELYTKEQQDEDRKRSNRSFKPDTDSRAFQQTERMREEYAKGQAKMRQWNAEIVEYERMKAHYKSLGEEPPYKTLGAFRREVRKPKEKQSNIFRSMRNFIAETNYNDVPLDKVIPLTQERIKGAKYEAKFAKSIPSFVVHTVAVKSRQILRENNRKREETAVCVSIETGEVLFEQHSKGLVIKVDASKLNGKAKDSVIITHNHPTGVSFSERDLEFMSNNPQIHTLFAVTPNGKVFSLRTNCGKTVDRYIVSEYNRYIGKGKSREEVLRDMAEKYAWEYKEV